MWDAGEFIAAVHTFGIPHQPGTPLYVDARARVVARDAVREHRARDESLLGRVHRGGGRRARVATRARDALVADGARGRVVRGRDVHGVVERDGDRGVRERAAARDAGIAGGAARERGGERERYEVASGHGVRFALAVPLHIGALVAAPAALVLVAHCDDGALEWPRALPLAAVMLFAAGIGIANVLRWWSWGSLRS